jgi:hypothetical protein
MASVLDIGLLSFFDVIFTFLLVLIVMFAILQKFQFPSDNKGINGLIAVSIAFLSLLSPVAIDLIKFIAPWFVLLFIFLILLLMTFRILGASEKNISDVVTADSAIVWVVLGVGLVIILAGFGQVLGQDLLEQQYVDSDGVVSADEISTTSEFQENVLQTLFHPKVLGMMALFGISIFAVALLSGKQ